MTSSAIPQAHYITLVTFNGFNTTTEISAVFTEELLVQCSKQTKSTNKFWTSGTDTLPYFIRNIHYVLKWHILT